MTILKQSGMMVTLLLAIGITYVFYKVSQTPELPKITVKYWGPGIEKPDDKSIKQFKISYPQCEVEKLKEKLDKARSFVPPLEGVGFEYGFNTNYLRHIVHFWKTEYNWTEREAYLNKYPQFTTVIGGLNIHFIHVKPTDAIAKGKEVLPLLMVHGWPSSFREFYNVIPLLTTPHPDTDFVFEVVAPSIPGYVFSTPPSKKGLGPAHIGALFNELMARLGHSKYYYQGGDWGSIIGHSMSIFFPDNVLAYHSNLCFVQNTKAYFLTALAYFFPKIFVDVSRQGQYISQFIGIYLKESGYFHIQATKPDTVGVALTDSPVGLAAYILEKFQLGTKKNWMSFPDRGHENLNKLDFLDNVMLYWLTNSITTSMRLYKETFMKEYQSLGIGNLENKVPTACAWFKNEVMYTTRIVLETVHKNLVQVNHYSTGGHFAALDEPHLFSEDVWTFVKKLKINKT